ncbi:lytic transglycosylase domain-containing protein [Peredibacter sp. HCB2-198]|uniref:lytic transglycosylase domain-containing protein n=1 Tax=Peredibacter sp. HCB2-198 TaxID=3383025 RepID=UPI0038B57AAA
MKTLFTLMILISGMAFASTHPTREIASVRRVEHARELMGASYKRSIVSRFEKRRDIEKNIHEVVQKRLPKAFKYRAYTIAKTIIEEAAKNSLDPYFVMAVISGESSFNPLAIGPVGEIGMMQIRPTTGQWMSELLKTKWQGEKTLRDPVANIKLGVAYLSWLRNKFEGHGQLYLAAYNMGPKSVKNAVSRNVYPKDYPIHVMKRYIAFYKDMGKKSGRL